MRIAAAPFGGTSWRACSNCCKSFISFVFGYEVNRTDILSNAYTYGINSKCWADMVFDMLLTESKQREATLPYRFDTVSWLGKQKLLSVVW